MGLTMKKCLAAVAVIAPLALGGCASQSEVDQLRSELKDAQAAAAKAESEAAAAKVEAAAATARADAAEKAAMSSSRKADRMYSRSLRK